MDDVDVHNAVESMHLNGCIISTFYVMSVLPLRALYGNCDTVWGRFLGKDLEHSSVKKQPPFAKLKNPVTSRSLEYQSSTYRYL